MKWPFILVALILTVCSCGERLDVNVAETESKSQITQVRVDRFAVSSGNPDSVTLSSYIMRAFDETGKEARSVYHSTDHSIMMQFVNQYADNKKTRVDWVNADGDQVKYVKKM